MKGGRISHPSAFDSGASVSKIDCDVVLTETIAVALATSRSRIAGFARQNQSTRPARQKTKGFYRDTEMDILRNRLGQRELLLGVIVVLALAGCATAHNQAPTAAASVASAPQAAPAVTQKAESAPPTMRPGTSPVASTRANTAVVLRQIHRTNLTEIALAKLAQEKASTDEVRAYADQLVQDHKNVDQTVVAMAQKNGAHLKSGAEEQRDVRSKTGREKQLERKLKAARGHDFDRLFLQETSSDHERLIRQLQQEREDGSDDELETLIDKTIPILEQQRELAQILMKKEKAEGRPIENHG
jgi:putative membrane protein